MTLQQIITADLGAVFADGLTLDVVHTYNGGASNETLKIFFDNPYDRALRDDSIESARPSILLQTAQAGNIADGSYFTILGSAYYLIESENDQEGVTRFYLSKDQV